MRPADHAPLLVLLPLLLLLLLPAPSCCSARSHPSACARARFGRRRREAPLPCLLVVARHQEAASDGLLGALQHAPQLPAIVFNSGPALGPASRGHSDDSSTSDNSGGSSRALCEHQVLSNVGRESFKYLSFIVENYARKGLAQNVIFCQAHPSHFGYSAEALLEDVRTLCAPGVGAALSSAGGFAYLGSMDPVDFHVGLDTAYSDRGIEMGIAAFRDLFNSTLLPAPFIPGGCFAVAWSQVRSRPRSHYRALLSARASSLAPGDEQLALNEGNAPFVGHVFERSWPRVFGSGCEARERPCCTLRCLAQTTALTEEGGPAATGQR